MAEKSEHFSGEEAQKEARRMLHRAVRETVITGAAVSDDGCVVLFDNQNGVAVVVPQLLQMLAEAAAGARKIADAAGVVQHFFPEKPGTGEAVFS